jgi:hypothetical protein
MPSLAESPLFRRDPDFRNFPLRRHPSLLSRASRGGRPSLATPYSIAAIVSRAKRARAVICRFRASVSAELAPCFRAFLLPLGGPPAAPCIRPNGGRAALQPAPLRFGVASRRQVYRQGHGLFSCFSVCPSPRGGGADVADDRLPALGDVDVLDGHLLLAA